MATLRTTDRVKIWNSFFRLAWGEAKSVFENSTGTSSTKDFHPLGGTLADEQFHILATLVLCNLAIEARANHLIEELKEEKTISNDVAEAARRLPTKHKWFLLPALARVPTVLDGGNPPHQAIAQICETARPLACLRGGEAKSVFENSTGTSSTKDFHPLGGTLADEQFHILATLVLCNLAIEARANHLIEELKEEKTISNDVAEAARRLPTKHKWFLLPALARVPTVLDGGNPPHQAIAQICGLRNDLMHVNYTNLKKRLPTAATVLNWFSDFVVAMEDMNVILERIRRKRRKVLEPIHYRSCQNLE